MEKKVGGAISEHGFKSPLRSMSLRGLFSPKILTRSLSKKNIESGATQQTKDVPLISDENVKNINMGSVKVFRKKF